MMSCLLRIVFGMAFLFVSACNPGSEKAFIKGKAVMACAQNIPACPGKFAACEINETTYTQQRFPDATPFRFMVEALPEDRIEVIMYLVEQENTGLDTRIYWYEPGCSDMYSYHSNGADLFAEAEDTNIISRKKSIYEGGKHLIELYSDMQAVLDITVDVSVRGE